nr:MAG: hypothetical protein [Bacteriophage sp.]DAG93415.1 MAG TPA: hypothetical protein [Crassvirales sp.]
MDGKGRKGPNMEVSEEEVSRLAINEEDRMDPK